MAMIKNAEVHFVRCDPKRPNASYNKKNPTWEVQIRTSDLAQRDEWKKQNLNVKMLTTKAEGADEDDPKVPVLTPDGKKIYRVNLKKGSIKKDLTKAEPVKVINGALEDIDPNTIANGSRANIRVFQYDYKNDEGEGIASMLMAIQVIKHIVYVPKARDDDFDMQDTEVIMAEDNDDEDEDASLNTKESKSTKPATPDGRADDDF
jgi:hypothetical protein